MFLKSRRQKKRKQGSFPFGVLIFFGALGVLIWNEGRAIKTARSLEEGSKSVVSVVADTIDAANDGKLVHVSGHLDTPNDAVYDQQLGLAFPQSLKVKREVQMYQWKRESQNKSQSKGSNSSYRYVQAWDNNSIDSKNFPPNYQNPSFVVEKQTFLAELIQLGAFTVTSSLMKDVPASAKVVLNDGYFTQSPSLIRRSRTLYNGDLYLSSSRQSEPTSPQIGDMRISLYAAGPMMASIVAQQQGSNLVPYPTKSGIALALLEPGQLQASEMFTQAVQENITMTWMVRGGGFVMMFVALHAMFYALVKIFRRIPIVGGMAESGAKIVSGILTIVIVLPTIAISWIVYRPVLGIGLGIAVIPVIVFSVLYAKKRTVRELQESREKRIMRLAMQQGGKLTVPEVVVGCDMDIEAAQQGLDDLTRKGMAGVEVTDSGVLVYAFSSIQHLDEKASSKDILNS